MYVGRHRPFCRRTRERLRRRSHRRLRGVTDAFSLSFLRHNRKITRARPPRASRCDTLDYKWRNMRRDQPTRCLARCSTPPCTQPAAAKRSPTGSRAIRRLCGAWACGYSTRSLAEKPWSVRENGGPAILAGPMLSAAHQSRPSPRTNPHRVDCRSQNPY